MVSLDQSVYVVYGGHQRSLHSAILSHADLSGAYLIEADLSGRISLIGANLSSANLGSADLSGAFLHVEKLPDAGLSNAFLEGADLSNASVANEQSGQALSLRGATMPNDQKYEDWVKSRGEDGEAGGP